jgi:hypothetical protein
MRVLYAPLIALLLAAPAAACPQCNPVKTVDLVICLDTSGSMSGLIDAARRKLWSLVSEVATAKPTPALRVALLTYGSPGDAEAGYVVRQTDFTTDLDLVSERLFALGTNGGDEYVGRVVARALDDLAWTAEQSLRLIFVAGNESADQDPLHPFRAEAERAVQRGAVVNAIYCGGADDGDAALWRELATRGNGRFASIDHQRGTVTVATPFDKPLADLSAKLNATYVFAGRLARETEERQRAQDRNAEAAGAPAAAERAAAKASGLYKPGGADLVDRLAADPAFDPATLPVEELDDELKAVPAAERKAHLEKKRAEREAVRAEIQRLDQQRREHVAAEMKRLKLDDGQSLDRALKDALREQAAAAGLSFDAPTAR